MALDSLHQVPGKDVPFIGMNAGLAEDSHHELMNILIEHDRPASRRETLIGPSIVGLIREEHSPAYGESQHCCINHRLDDLFVRTVDDVQSISGFQFLEEHLDKPTSSIQICHLMGGESFRREIREIEMVFVEQIVFDANQAQFQRLQAPRFAGIPSPAELDFNFCVYFLALESFSDFLEGFSNQVDSTTSMEAVYSHNDRVGIIPQATDEVSAVFNDLGEESVFEKSQIEQQEMIFHPVPDRDRFEFSDVSSMDSNRSSRLIGDRQDDGYLCSRFLRTFREYAEQRFAKGYYRVVENRDVLEKFSQPSRKRCGNDFRQRVLEKSLEEGNQVRRELSKEGGRGKICVRNGLILPSQPSQRSLDTATEAQNQVPKEQHWIDLAQTLDEAAIVSGLAYFISREESDDLCKGVFESLFGIEFGGTSHGKPPAERRCPYHLIPGVRVQRGFLTGFDRLIRCGPNSDQKQGVSPEMRDFTAFHALTEYTWSGITIATIPCYEAILK